MVTSSAELIVAVVKFGGMAPATLKRVTPPQTVYNEADASQLWNTGNNGGHLKTSVTLRSEGKVVRLPSLGFGCQSLASSCDSDLLSEDTTYMENIWRVQDVFNHMLEPDCSMVLNLEEVQILSPKNAKRLSSRRISFAQNFSGM